MTWHSVQTASDVTYERLRQRLSTAEHKIRLLVRAISSLRKLSDAGCHCQGTPGRSAEQRRRPPTPPPPPSSSRGKAQVPAQGEDQFCPEQSGHGPAQYGDEQNDRNQVNRPVDKHESSREEEEPVQGQEDDEVQPPALEKEPEGHLCELVVLALTHHSGAMVPFR